MLASHKLVFSNGYPTFDEITPLFTVYDTLPKNMGNLILPKCPKCGHKLKRTRLNMTLFCHNCYEYVYSVHPLDYYIKLNKGDL